MLFRWIWAAIRLVIVQRLVSPLKGKPSTGLHPTSASHSDLIKALNAALEKSHRLQEAAVRDSDRTFRWTRNLTTATVAVAVLSVCYARYTLIDTQNAERAWIRAEVSPANLTWKQQTMPGGQSIESASMATSLFVTNEGKRPAFSVHGFITGLAVHGANGLVVNDKEDCDGEASKLESEKGPHIGQIVFPSQHSKVVDIGTESADIGFVRIPNHIFDPRRDSFLLNTVIRADLHGCIIYKRSPSGEYHHTMFNFNLERTDKDPEQKFFFEAGTTVLAKDIKLFQIETESDAD